MEISSGIYRAGEGETASFAKLCYIYAYTQRNVLRVAPDPSAGASRFLSITGEVSGGWFRLPKSARSEALKSDVACAAPT